jgi:undecaprenyl-diphosphatase
MFFVFLAKYLILVFPIFFVYLLYKRKFKVVILASLSGLLAKGLEVLTGFIYYVPRPFIVNPNLPYYKNVVGGLFSGILGENSLPHDSSFFSAHAATSFAAATVIYLAYSKRAGLVLLILAGLVALGRVLTNVHYPIDVIVGAGVGLTLGTLCGKLLN